MNPRPLYETNDHRLAEAGLIDWLSERWKVKAEKLPISYGLEGVFMKGGRPAALFEIKGKPKHTIDEMVRMVGGIPLDLDKMERGLNFQTITGLPFAVICAFDDGIYYRVLKNISNEAPFLVRFGGRKDRGDWQDREPYIVIDRDGFRYLGPNLWSRKARLAAEQTEAERKAA